MHVVNRFNWLTCLAVIVAVIFTAGTAQAQVYSSTPNLSIPDDFSTGVSDSIVVASGPASITSMKITVNVAHMWCSDVRLYLLRPGQTWASPGLDAANGVPTNSPPAGMTGLLVNIGTSNVNFTNTEFTNAADPTYTGAVNLSLGTAPYTGLFLPVDTANFNAAYGTDSNGTWTIVAMDDEGGIAGTLLSWSIEFPMLPGDPEIDVQRPAANSIGIGTTDNVGSQLAGSATAFTYTVENLGAANTLNVTNIVLQNPTNCSGTVSSTSFTVAPGNTQTFNADITPTGAGAFSIDLVITNDDADEGTYTITIAGTGLVPLGVGYVENFDSFTRGNGSTNYVNANIGNNWTNLTNDNFDWQVWGGPTSSGTGPTADHTTGTAVGNYVYTESSSPNSPTRTATLVSPLLDSTGGAGTRFFSFWHQVRGTSGAVLHIDVIEHQTGGGTTTHTDVIPQIVNSNNLWIESAVNLSAVPFTGNWTGIFQVVFRHVTGTSFDSDTGIDDFTYDQLDDPEIDVQRPAGNRLVSGSTEDIGAVAGAQVLTYTVENQGVANTLNVTDIQASNATNCSATFSTTSFTVAPGTTQTFDVTLTPGGGGVFSVDIVITSDDASEGTYTITITGGSAFSGTFVINGAGGAGVAFTDIGAAMDALEQFGVAGNTTFDIFDDGGDYTSAPNYELAGVAGAGPNAQIIFRAAAGESPVVAGAGVPTALTVIPNCGIRVFDCPFVTIRGIEFAGAGTGTGIAIFVDTGDVSYATVENNIVHGYGNQAITIYKQSSVDGDIENCVVRNNVIYNCVGAQIVGNPNTPFGAIGVRRAINASFIYNTIIHNNAATPAFSHQQGTGGMEVGAFSNNIVYANQASQAYHQSGAGPLSANGNVWYLGAGVPFSLTGPGTFALWQNAGYDANGQQADPLMFDPLNGNFHIGAGSPAVDAAQGSFGVLADIDGDTRPTGAASDAGADEYNPANAPIEINTQYRGANVADGGAVDLGNLGTGVAMSFTFTVANVGGGSLTVNNVTVSNEVNATVTISTQPTSPVAAGGSTTFVVEVTATGVGAVSFDLSFGNDDANENPYDISVTGTGVAPTPEISVQRPALNALTNGATDNVGRIAEGQLSQFTYTIENIGSADLTITSVSATAGAGSPTVSISTQPNSPVSAQSSTTFVVDVTPALGAFDLTVTIDSDDPVNGTFTITIQGTGALSGTYTIDNDAANNPDFADFGAAFSSLEANGVVGAVTFEVYTGLNPYTSAGLYTLNEVPNQSVNNPITFRPAPGNKPVVQGGGASGGILAGAGIMLAGCQFVTIEGIEFDGNGVANFGVAIHSDTGFSSANNRVMGCTIHGTVGPGIAVFTFSAVSSSVANAQIVNNLIYNCTGNLVTAPRGALFLGAAKNAVVYHNTVVKTTGTEPAFVHNQVFVSQNALRVSNNIFYAENVNTAYGHDGTHALNGNGNIWHLGTGVAFGENNLTFTGWQSQGFDGAGLMTDPGFRDPAGNDFHLAPNSPARDAAVNVQPAVNTDYEGDARPIGNANDTGADEFNPNGPAEIRMGYRGNNVADGSSVNVGNLGAGVAMNFTFDISNVGGVDLILNGNPVVAISNEANCTVSVATVPATPIASGDSTQLVLTVTATNQGMASSFDVSIDNSDADENPYNFTVNATAVAPAPQISVQYPVNTALNSPANVNAGTVPVNGMLTYEFTIENAGSAQLNLTGTPAVSPSVNSGTVTLSVTQPTSAALAVQETTTFTVEITPTLAGVFGISLTIASNDATTPNFIVNISGTAADQPNLVVDSSLDFGSLIAGLTSVRTLTLRNTGNVQLSITGLILFNQSFVVADSTQAPFAIDAGQTRDIPFRFVPQSVGNFSATLTIISDSGGNPGTQTTVTFTGIGTTGSGTVDKKEGCGVMPDGGQNPLWFAVLALMMALAVIRRRFA